MQRHHATTSPSIEKRGGVKIGSMQDVPVAFLVGETSVIDEFFPLLVLLTAGIGRYT